MDPDRRDPQKADRRTMPLPRNGHGRRSTDKLACPHCDGYQSKVTDVRPSMDGGVYRRRECLTCHRRFSTEETVKPYATKKSDAAPEHNM